MPDNSLNIAENHLFGFSLQKSICSEYGIVPESDYLIHQLRKCLYGKLKDEKAHKISLSQKLNSFIEKLKRMPIAIDHFDDTTFRFMVERVTVSKDKKLTFKFRNGKEIQV